MQELHSGGSVGNLFCLLPTKKEQTRHRRLNVRSHVWSLPVQRHRVLQGWPAPRDVAREEVQPDHGWRYTGSPRPSTRSHAQHTLP